MFCYCIGRKFSITFRLLPLKFPFGLLSEIPNTRLMLALSVMMISCFRLIDTPLYLISCCDSLHQYFMKLASGMTYQTKPSKEYPEYHLIIAGLLASQTYITFSTSNVKGPFPLHTIFSHNMSPFPLFVLQHIDRSCNDVLGRSWSNSQRDVSSSRILPTPVRHPCCVP